MANANDLPQDLWELIAAYLSPRNLKDLIGVNRQLLNIVLHERYREVSWVDPNKSMSKKLRRLGDPSIACHVRKLHIQAWFMKRLLGIPLDAMDGKFSVGPKPEGRAKTSFRELFRIPKKQSRARPGYFEDSGVSFAQRVGIVGETKAILAAMGKAMGLMVNAKEFVVEWRNLPLTTQAKVFLASARQAFQSNLCKLTLSGHLTRLREIVPLIETLRLEELSLRFDFNPRVKAITRANEVILSDVIAPYLNGLKSTLRTLQIISQASGDHSQLFLSLLQLPQLHKLVLEIAFDQEQISEPKGLVNFLELNNFGFHHLEIVPHRDYGGGRSEFIKQNWDLFCRQLLSIKPFFPNSKTLHLRSPAEISLVRSISHQMPTMLTDLCLTHRYYTVDEVSTISAIISDRVDALRRLSLDIVSMTPNLIQLLAARFPTLYALTLIIERDDVPRSDLQFLFGAEGNIRPRFIDWNLVDLSIYLKKFRTTSYENSDSSSAATKEHYLMLDVKDLVGGSITSFKGTGHILRI